MRPRVERPRLTIIDAAAVEAAELLEAADDAQAADGDGAVVAATACISERGAPSPKRAGIPCADAHWLQQVGLKSWLRPTNRPVNL